MCSCQDIREKIIEAKTGFVRKEGLPPALRLLEDVAMDRPDAQNHGHGP